MPRTLVCSLVIVLGLVAPAMAAPRSFAVAVSGHGRPVVLIPGLACDGHVWDATVARYKEGHQLHVLTLAGFAGQPAIEPPLLSTVRAELAGYIRAQKLDKPIVVGHSLGGFVALWLAATEPDLVGGVVVVDALPFLPAARQPSATVESVKPQAEMLRTMFAQLTPEAFAAQNRAALATMITDPKNVEPVAAASRRSDVKTVGAALYEMMTTDLRSALARVRSPTLVLAAAAPDPADGVRKVYAAQYATLKGVRLVVADKSRHFIMLDDPSFFFAQLDSILH
jgi:pimeloyl-ACP methyl ester carboxylesterase